MHDVLRQRLLRRIESLPENQVYQVLDYIEFLESKYAKELKAEATGLQRFAEGLEDRMRKRAMSPATLREAFQLIAAADKVLSGVSTAGKQLLSELGGSLDGPDGPDEPDEREERVRAGREERGERLERGADSPSGGTPPRESGGGATGP